MFSIYFLFFNVKHPFFTTVQTVCIYLVNDTKILLSTLFYSLYTYIFSVLYDVAFQQDISICIKCIFLFYMSIWIFVENAEINIKSGVLQVYLNVYQKQATYITHTTHIYNE